MKLFVLAALLVPCLSLQETHHFLHLADDGQSIHQDIIYDEKENTVLIIIGDVSAYKYSAPTINLHDYNTGYVVFKDIKQQMCSLSRVPIPKLAPEMYRMGVSNQTLRFTARYDPTPLTYTEVKEIAGSKIADFCKDYVTFTRTLTPKYHNDHIKREVQEEKPLTPCDHLCWICVIHSDLTTLNRDDLQSLG